MSRLRLLAPPLLALAYLALGACSSPTGPAGLAQWEHQAFYGLDPDTVWLEMAHGEAHYASEDIAKAHNHALSEAWEAGQAPASPLIGRDPALWIRALDVRAQADGSLHLRARALAPYPIRFSLVAMEDGQERLLGQLTSEAWSAGTHFAKVEVDYLMVHPQATLILRSEGAYQAMESILRLVPEGAQSLAAR